MAFPKMTELFGVKESVDRQHWTSNGKRYNVGKLYKWARQNGHEIQIIPVKDLEKGFNKTKTDETKESEAFWERAERAGSHPILTVIDEKNRHWIADGNHRFAKAKRDGLTEIHGYVVNESDLPADAIEPKKTPKQK
jgi:hypothetical protein